jgi:hypothetical protein
VSAQVFKHDLAHEQLRKLPRAGMWNRWNGKVTIRCPVCYGAPSGDAHAISKDGVVSPSFVCKGPGCYYREFVTLDGYTASSEVTP